MAKDTCTDLRRFVRILWYRDVHNDLVESLFYAFSANKGTLQLFRSTGVVTISKISVGHTFIEKLKFTKYTSKMFVIR